MIVRTEKIRGTDRLLVIDEINRYLCQISEEDFMECILEDSIPFEEDGYTYHKVNQNLMFNLAQK